MINNVLDLFLDSFHDPGGVTLSMDLGGAGWNGRPGIPTPRILASADDKLKNFKRQIERFT